MFPYILQKKKSHKFPAKAAEEKKTLVKKFALPKIGIRIALIEGQMSKSVATEQKEKEKW